MKSEIKIELKTSKMNQFFDEEDKGNNIKRINITKEIEQALHQRINNTLAILFNPDDNEHHKELSEQFMDILEEALFDFDEDIIPEGVEMLSQFGKVEFKIKKVKETYP